MVVGAVPEEREEGHQFTPDVDEDGIHAYKTVGMRGKEMKSLL